MTIAVDFDGTIVEHKYPEIGKEIPFAIETLKKLQEEFHTLVLWTVREGELLEAAVQYCKNKGLEFHAANKNYPEEDVTTAPRKLSVDIFIDDRNLGGLPDWGIIYQMIKEGTNYSPNNIESFERSSQRGRKNFFIRLGEALDRAQGKRY